MNWLNNPYIDLTHIADKLYGGRSRLHTRKLRDRVNGRFAFQPWELDRLNELKEQIIQHLNSK